jgi:hypothetical protein
MTAPRDQSWFRELGARVKSHWRFKAIGTIGFFAAFFLGYFVLLRHPLFDVTLMPLLAVDRWLAFRPWTLSLYVSLWLYVQFAPAAIADRRTLISFAWGATGLMLAGFALFFFWPTRTPPAEIDWARHAQFSRLKTVDASGNACPSLHVAFAVFFAVWNHRLLRELRARAWMLWLNSAWCIGIIYSTLATKQHVALDALAGTVLGAIAVAIHLGVLASQRRHAEWGEPVAERVPRRPVNLRP